MTVIEAPSVNLAIRTDGNARNKTPEAIESALHPVRTAFLLPVHDHGRLREPKREKSADCIPRDQLVGDPNENENCKHDDDPKSRNQRRF